MASVARTNPVLFKNISSLATSLHEDLTLVASEHYPGFYYVRSNLPEWPTETYIPADDEDGESESEDFDIVDFLNPYLQDDQCCLAIEIATHNHTSFYFQLIAFGPRIDTKHIDLSDLWMNDRNDRPTSKDYLSIIPSWCRHVKPLSAS